MALTVRPDDEVYQFDTVWLGPDEYTLPIQARYVAWGTWLACFLVAAAILVPLGGSGPGGVLGSLVWALALSVVLSRAVMLVVDHERPLRSLPALFSAEARAALAARRRAERALLVRPDRVRVRPTPPRVRAIRERQRRRAERRAARRPPAPVPTLPPGAEPEPVEVGASLAPDWRTGDSLRPEWTPDPEPAGAGGDPWGDGPVDPEPAPAWSVPTDDPHGGLPQPRHPVAAAEARAGRPAPAGADPFRPQQTDAREAARPEPAAGHPGAVRVSPNGVRDGRAGRDRPEPRDRQAAVEARILLPVRKER